MAKVGAFTRLESGLNLKVDPKIVLSSKILQLTQQELEQAIEVELADNPALERLQDDVDPITDETILRAVAPQELKPQSEDFQFTRSLPNDDTGVDWIDLASTTTSLWEHLRAQLLPAVPSDLRYIAEYVVDCVNENGYLGTPAEEIALGLDADLDEVITVLNHLRNCEPAGVGANDVQDCLLLQLREAITVEEKLARAILKNNMDEFIARDVKRIARRYKALPGVVDQAFAVILSLSPYPGQAFSNLSQSMHSASYRMPAVLPDLTLTLSEYGWYVEVRGSDPNSLTIERAYRKRYEELRSNDRAPKDEKRHVDEYVKRAANFIQSIHQRRRTLRRIGEHLVQNQSGFVSTGRYEFLQPLTRSKVAADLGIHESTVSRATMGKFVQIGNGELVSFEVFFKPALRIQKMIEEILHLENPNTPMSDEAIAVALKKKGVIVARRTVNKYRDKTKLLSSRKRKVA
ncbi:MAG: RNA polymerase factor sigma-54 [Fimbriimonadaceae bacterium]